MPSSPASFLPQGSVWDAEFRPPKAQYLVDPDISPEEQLRGTVKYEQIQPPSDNTDSIPVPIEIKDRRWSNMALKLDPRPLKRQLYQRKRITRAVQSKWSMTRKEILNMTERKVVQRSANLSTSTKKLMLLARQVAGKTLEEAEAQMRFSKKRYALSLRLLLEQVRNRAVIESGMGLGTDLPKGQEKHIVLKDGRKHKVKNETGLYLDQAWVEKGQHMKDVEFRAKGKVNRILHRQSRVVLQLKEEKTRIREHNEREAKRAQRKPWTQLPDRPVTFQHQHCLW
ncbi:ribosomal protein L22 [Pseudovirgaria hyperparasitica]|uniref:Ribosomal protein L22 n=1 Tax=Pseudovirgaria hyperparasitica TaxID=470096 RepID=A0A6A6WA25_9PEZI|nr:ribosomal protein L22 [Pseudovirgaria hyperparasitica]KAF2758437.1 ribosomal protein L22 [Pseudovirgaria hyperparasitica]